MGGLSATERLRIFDAIDTNRDFSLNRAECDAASEAGRPDLCSEVGDAAAAYFEGLVANGLRTPEDLSVEQKLALLQLDADGDGKVDAYEAVRRYFPNLSSDLVWAERLKAGEYEFREVQVFEKPALALDLARPVPTGENPATFQRFGRVEAYFSPQGFPVGEKGWVWVASGADRLFDTVAARPELKVRAERESYPPRFYFKGREVSEPEAYYRAYAPEFYKRFFAPKEALTALGFDGSPVDRLQSAFFSILRGKYCPIDLTPIGGATGGLKIRMILLRFSDLQYVSIDIALPEENGVILEKKGPGGETSRQINPLYLKDVNAALRRALIPASSRL